MSNCYVYIDYTKRPVIIVNCIQNDVCLTKAVFWQYIDADIFARMWLNSHNNHDPYQITHSRN